ncbi:MAG: putative RND superfamily exporter protein [Pseudoalteromonas tetraodonis]|jgi:predicted RND superfamily exporter protein
MAAWLVKNRVWLAILSLVTTVAAGYGSSFLWFEKDYKIFFSDDNPQLIAHNKIEDEYTKSDNVIFIIAPNNGEVFSRETLDTVEELTERAWQLPRSIRVDSITNYQHTYSEFDDLIVLPLAENSFGMTDEQLQQAKEVALSEPALVHSLISDTAHVTAIFVSLDMPVKESNTVEERERVDSATTDIVKMAREMRDLAKERNANIDIYLQGTVMINTAFNENSQADMSTLVPMMFIAILVLLLVFYRSVGSTLTTLAVIIVSNTLTIGLMGWLDVPINQVNISAPIIIMTLAVCDAVHILISYQQGVGRQLSKVDAMVSSLKINLQPVMLTSFTTAVGFLSLNFGDSPPLIGLGNICAAGVIVAMIFSLTLLPAMAILLPVNGRKASTGSGIISTAADVVINNPKTFFIGTIVVALGWMAFIPQNELSDDSVEYFHKGVPFRDAADFMQENLTGVDTINYSISCGSENCVNEPEFLSMADDFVTWYKAQPDVLHVSSFTTTMKRLNRVMNNEDPSKYVIPDSRELAAQYMLLYEFSLPFGLDLNNQINFDKSALKITANLRFATAKDLLLAEEAAQAWFAENYPQFQSTGAGVSLMFAHIGQRNIHAMINGSVLALLLIAVTLMIALKSFKFGLISMIPNAFPAAIAFGIWAVIDGQVNLAVAAVFSISLGIVVDDTVHFLSKYLHARRVKKLPVVEGVRYAVTTVGSALVVTSVALAVGFFIMGQSTFDVNSSMGLMVAMTIVIALVFDLLFLPAMLILMDKDD